MPEELDDDLEAMPRGTIPRVIAVIAAALTLVFVIVWLLSGGGAEFFQRKFHLHTYLSDSGSIGEDAVVILNGVSIGRVSKVQIASSLDPNRAVRVDMEIQRRYMNLIPVDSVAALTADNLIGDRYVGINVGKAADHVGDGAEIASLLQNGNFNPADLVSSLQITLQRIDAIFNEIQSGDTPTSRFVRGDLFYRGVESQLAVLQRTVHMYANPRTEAGKFFFTPEIYNQIEKQIATVDGSLQTVQRGENPAGRFLNDPGMYDRSLAQIRKVHQSIDNDRTGKSGEWLQSDAKYQQIRAKLDSLNLSIDRLNDPKTKFGALLASSQIYDKYAKETGSMEVFLREFREDPQRFLRIKIFGKKKKAPQPHP